MATYRMLSLLQSPDCYQARSLSCCGCLCAPREKPDMEHREHSSEGPSVFDNRSGARCVPAIPNGAASQHFGVDIFGVHVVCLLEAVPNSNPTSGLSCNVMC